MRSSRKKEYLIIKNCFICGQSVTAFRSYYERNGNCCVSCNVRCGKVGSKKMTIEEADKILLKVRK